MNPTRDDLINGLTPNESDLMERFRERKPKAYTFKQLQRVSRYWEYETNILEILLNSLLKKNLIMKMEIESTIYYMLQVEDKK